MMASPPREAIILSSTHCSELAGRRLVQADGGSDEGHERPLVDLIVLVEVDCAPGVASRLELKSPDGSSSEAPLKNVSFTTLLYVSPVQIGPW
jgi:hypothetical protein